MSMLLVRAKNVHRGQCGGLIWFVHSRTSLTYSCICPIVSQSYPPPNPLTTCSRASVLGHGSAHAHVRVSAYVLVNVLPFPSKGI